MEKYQIIDKVWKHYPTVDDLISHQPWMQVFNFGSISTLPFTQFNDEALYTERERFFIEIIQTLEDKDVNKTKTLFDLGCGPGFFCFIAAAMGYDVTGFEPIELFVRQANFLNTFLKDDIHKPIFKFGSNRTISEEMKVWDMGILMATFQELSDPINSLLSISERVREVLILETEVYFPPYIQPFNNSYFHAACTLTNWGRSAPHRSIDGFSLVLSLPALVFGLHEVGFESIAYVMPPMYWAKSSQKFLRRFFIAGPSTYNVYLIAFKNDILNNKNDGLSFPPNWIWLNNSPSTLNYNYFGPLSNQIQYQTNQTVS